MFLLSETELVSSIPLKSISRIDISFYNSRNEFLNIFNLEMDFDENIIPLITSILECKPNLIHRKTYKGLDCNYIIEYDYPNNGMLLEAKKDNIERFPSFHLDIEAFNKKSNSNLSHTKSYWQSRKLHYINVYAKSKELVKIYSSVDTKDDARNKNIFNPQDTLGYSEEIVIYWSIPNASSSDSNGFDSKFELCILSNTEEQGKQATQAKQNMKCIWRLVVDVIEDNHFIDSKVDAVNTWLEKIHKIKSTITIANQ